MEAIGLQASRTSAYSEAGELCTVDQSRRQNNPERILKDIFGFHLLDAVLNNLNLRTISIYTSKHVFRFPDLLQKLSKKNCQRSRIGKQA